MPPPPPPPPPRRPPGSNWEALGFYTKKSFIGSCFPWSIKPGVQWPWKEVLGAGLALFPECPKLLSLLQAVFGVPCSVAVSRCQAALEESQDVVLDGLLHWTEGQGMGEKHCE